MSFASVAKGVAQRMVAKKKYSTFKTAMQHARAIIASGARGASEAAKRKNPALRKVKG